MFIVFVTIKTTVAMKKITLLLSLLFLMLALGQAQSVWVEDFLTESDDGVGAVGGSDITLPSSGKWSLDVTSADLEDADDWFKVKSGVLEGRDLGGEAVWISESINISGCANVYVSMTVSEVGGLETADYIKAFYSLDGADSVAFLSLSDDFADTTISVGGLTGSSLVLYAKISTSASDEKIRLENVEVKDSVIPAVLAPQIIDALPETSATFDLGVPFMVSATVLAGADATVDSVVLVYGESTALLSSRLKCMSEVDTFYTYVGFDKVDTIYGQLVAYGSNMMNDTSDVVQVFGKCGEVDAPVAGEAESVTKTSFTATWSDSDDADGYLLDVWTVGDEEVYVSSNFDDGVSPLTEGWGRNDRVYTSSTSFDGKGLKLGASGEAGVLFSPGFIPNADFSVVFYAKAYKDDEHSINVSYGSQSVDVTLLEDDWGAFVVDFTARDVEDSVVFTANRAYMDSVVIKSGSDQEYILQGDSVEGTSKLVEELDVDACKYAVRAYSSYGCVSEYSNEVAVSLGVTTNITAKAETSRVYATMGGINVVCEGAVLVSVYDIYGRQVRHDLVNGQACLSVEQGVYLVRVGDGVSKVAVW